MNIHDALNQSSLVVVTKAWRGGDARPLHPDDFQLNASAADMLPPDTLADDQENQP